MTLFKTLNTRLSDYFTEKRLKNLFMFLFVLSLIPIIALCFFDYATGDDLLVGSVVMEARRNGLGFWGTTKAIFTSIYQYWLTFEGTWFSEFLWRLEPSVWGERVYTVTGFIGLLALTVGPFLLLKELLVELLKLSKNSFLIFYFAFEIILIQYMPSTKGGLYFYCGMIMYTLSFGMACTAISWGLRFIRTGKKHLLIFSSIVLTLVGGMGYPDIMFAGVTAFFIIVNAFVVDKDRRKQTLLLIIPLVLLAIGFGVSAIAPGNSVRGGESFSWSIGEVFMTLLLSLKNGIVQIPQYLISVRPLFIYYIGLILFAWARIDTSKSLLKLDHPIIVTIELYLISSSTYAPEMFVREGVDAGISGGVYNTYYLVFLMCTSLALIYVVGFIKARVADRCKGVCDPSKISYCGKIPYMAFVVLFILVFGRHLVSNMFDYKCITFASSGRLADFVAQMEERNAILNDPTITDPVLPLMNDDQGPYMHMAILEGEGDYTNYATALFYGKNSVIGMNRDEWYERYEELYGQK